VIPLVVTYCQRRRDGRWLRLYIPVLPVVLLLSPLLVMAGLAGLVACVIFGVDPVGALRGVGRVLRGLPGTEFEIEGGRTAVLVSVR